MAFRFASLGSGSRGNATLVEAGDTCVLIDCGFAAREFAARCERLEFDPARLSAILVTHEHGDHTRGVGAVARRFDLPVCLSHGTWHACRLGALPSPRRFAAHDGAFAIGELSIQPVPVPHDAREPIQFVFRHRSSAFGVLTDLGSVTPRIVEAFDGVDALLLECNHDPTLLAQGPYPPSLQARVGGRFGHLANAQAAQLLGAIDHARLRHLVAGHLSEQNNHPDLARAALENVAEGIGERLSLLMQDDISGWFDIVD
jgi:phosphoribosyl 1,2-cyclic phosphodiesterase